MALYNEDNLIKIDPYRILKRIYGKDYLESLSEDSYDELFNMIIADRQLVEFGGEYYELVKFND